MKGVLVVLEGVAELLAEDFIAAQLGHLVKTAGMAADQTGPESELLDVLSDFHLRVSLIEFLLNHLFEVVVCHSAHVAVAQLLGALVVPAEGASLSLI